MIGKFEPDDPFTFTAKYKTDIQLVDDEHRRLFEIIKEANDLEHFKNCFTINTIK